MQLPQSNYESDSANKKNKSSIKATGDMILDEIEEERDENTFDPAPHQKRAHRKPRVKNDIFAKR